MAVGIEELAAPQATAAPAEKLDFLRRRLRQLGRVIVAYSGGVDSALLSAVGHEVLGDNCLSVTADSETLSAAEGRDALGLARDRGWNHRIIHYSELAIPGYAQNPTNRCYFCKDELFKQLERLAEDEGYPYILDGSNWDDTGDHRPGRRAAREHRVQSPLLDARMTKEDIRTVAREVYHLPLWDKPSFACLSSRIPYGEMITREKLAMVASAEDILRRLGLRQFRVRHTGEHHARIEVPAADLPRVLEHREEVVAGFKAQGYLTVSLDLEGYRSGSLNAALPAGALERERPAEPAFRPKTFGPGIHVLYADGACDGNPGPASFAAVLFDDGGREVERASGPIGKATNNIAEYVALQRGLECALARGVRRIHVLMDSELVVRQMSGQYRVKHPNLKKLYAAVEPLRKRFAHFAISYVPRHLNGLADRLASAALKGK